MHTGTTAEMDVFACVNCPEHVLSLIRTSLSGKAVSVIGGVRVCLTSSVCVDRVVAFHFRRVNYYELPPLADYDNNNNYIRIGRMLQCCSR